MRYGAACDIDPLGPEDDKVCWGLCVRALLVEDEALVALIAEEALSGLGFEVEVAASGQEALAALARSPPDLAVIDIGLPDMRGDDLAHRFRTDAPSTSNLMASGYDAAEIAAKFPADFRVAVVAKPYTEGDLAAAIAQLGLS